MTKEEAQANRTEAVSRGEPHYMGRPCLYGHVGKRYVRHHECVDCKVIRDLDPQKKIIRVAQHKKNLANLEYRAARTGSTVPTRPCPEFCELCGGPGRDDHHSLCLDHCHVTGEFRFWLCDRCNRGLGFFRENPVLLRKAADMIEAFNEEVLCEDS